MKIDYTEGILFLHKKEWYLDAEPHVLVLFERLFPSTKILFNPTIEGVNLQFTQRPRVINDSVSICKDIKWFIRRYNIKVSEKNMGRLKRRERKYDNIIKESKEIYFNYKPIELELALPLRKYQEQGVALSLHKKSMLIADQVGLGKTCIATAVASKNLPAVCIVPPHLVSQWKFEIKKFLPKAKIYTNRSWKYFEVSSQKKLPEADFYIDSYSRVYKGVDYLLKIKPKTLILDEVHSLRHTGTKKYDAVKDISKSCKYILGLSATPIMNYGDELYNIFQILNKGCLGDEGSFQREWCDSGSYGKTKGQIRDPELLGNFLRKNFLMTRRTRKEVGMQLEDVNRIVYTVDADMNTLHKFEEEAKVLAMKVISGDFNESGSASREFDFMLRQATGVAKAKAVAEVVKMVVESGEKVVLFGWHRKVYDIWMNELKYLYPVMYTGSESIKEKEEALKQFVEGDAKVFIISLRSGAGINGLQLASSYVIFGELDWSSGIIDQCIGRLWRDGQDNKVTAMFITIEDGADPIMKKVIGKKALEAKKILSPEAELLTQTSDHNQIQSMAREWLKTKGVDVDSIVEKREKESKGELYIQPPKEGKVYDIWSLLKKSILSVNDERSLQEEIETLFTRENIEFEREVNLSKNSRVDFKVGDILLECKAGSFSKRNMLRQIKKYKKDYEKTESIIIVVPAPMKHFQIKGLPVYIVNTSDSSLMVEGLG